jgi:hypothetical protein
VAKAALTAAATSISVPYNQPIPKLTYTLTGFVNGDPLSVVTGTPIETTTATKGSNVGAYTIGISQGTLAATNYSFTMQNGTLTVTSLGTTTAPVLSLAAGTFTSAQSLTIKDATSGAVIYYTTNGATPTTSSAKYQGAIPVSANETINAIAVAPGYSPSTVVTAAYVIAPPAAAPTFSPPAGTYTSARTVTIKDTTPGATIYYTADGSPPTTSSTPYSSAIYVGSTQTTNAIATAPAYSSSPVASAAYAIDPPAPAPTIMPFAGTYYTPQTVTLADMISGATIYYTTDGSIPTTSSTLYTAAGIKVTASETISAMAFAPGFSHSILASAVYTIPTLAAGAVGVSCPNVVQRGVTGWNGKAWYNCQAYVGGSSSPKVTWSTKSTSLLTIDAASGAITPLARGAATITATSTANPSMSASTTVKVVDRVLATKAEGGWMMLWYFETDGSDSGELLTSRECWYPSVAPDHQHVACSTFELSGESLNGGTQLIVVNTDNASDGKSTATLLTNINSVMYSAWSADGRKIAFFGTQKDANSGGFLQGIFTINADGTGLTQLTSTLSPCCSIMIPGSGPSFSPDGKYIAYTVASDGFIHLMNADGTNQAALPVSGYNPVFSSDGARILYLGNGLESVNLDGSDPQVVLSQCCGYYFAISPSWTQIAYENGSGIYIANADGDGQVPLPGGNYMYGSAGLAW